MQSIAVNSALSLARRTCESTLFACSLTGQGREGVIYYRNDVALILVQIWDPARIPFTLRPRVSIELRVSSSPSASRYRIWESALELLWRQRCSLFAGYRYHW